MVIKYGSFYISWVNLKEYEFGVDEKHKAGQFTHTQIEQIVTTLGLHNYQVEE